MSWQDDAMIDQEISDSLFEMGEAEWRESQDIKQRRYNVNSI